jgi:GTP-binding protein EngB required for normal cell division
MQSSTPTQAEDLHSSYLASSDWYWNQARPVLEEHAPERLQEFEKQLETLEQLAKIAKEPFTACFLGQSQIGKSTLINALVADDKVLLPAGGIGPLTAQAIKVSYAAVPFLEVAYQDKKKVLGLLFALERQLDRQNANAGKESPAVEQDEEQIELDAEDRLDIAAVEEATALTPAMQDRVKQATLLIAGDQNSARSLEYICDSLRRACGMKCKWNTVPQAADNENITRLESTFRDKSAAVFRTNGSMEERDFIRESRLHSAGALAPMVRDLSLGWPSALLQSGVRLVDLPGVGVADDAHRSVTRSWVKEKANAISLVVRQSGIDEASAELLRSSEFLTRVLYSIDDPEADPVRLFVIVVKMDELAQSRFVEEKTQSPERYRRKVEHLREAFLEIKPTICAQMHSQMERLTAENDGASRAALQSASTRLIDALQIFPVSTLEYIRLIREDEEDSSFLKTEEDSGLPQLRTFIKETAFAIQSARRSKFLSRSDEFHGQIVALLHSIRVQWTEEADLAEAERIGRLLQPFLEPKKRELAARQGNFKGFLETAIPQEIDLLIERAAWDARRSMLREIRKLQDANWSTLKAVIVRGGAYYGKRPVDLPRNLASKFEEHVAPIWSTKVIGQVRDNTAKLADYYVRVVTQAVEWAEQNGARSRSTVVQALADNIRQEGRRMVQVGRDGADDLREAVKQQLLDGVQEPIRRRCKQFAASEEASGRGVKQRMLQFFEDDILEIVVEAAKPAAARILKTNYANVKDEIVECFRQFSDPLADAEQKIIGTHLDAEKRSKAQRRARVLPAIDSVLNYALPAVSTAITANEQE